MTQPKVIKQYPYRSPVDHTVTELFLWAFLAAGSLFVGLVLLHELPLDITLRSVFYGIAAIFISLFAYRLWQGIRDSHHRIAFTDAGLRLPDKSGKQEIYVEYADILGIQFEREGQKVISIHLTHSQGTFVILMAKLPRDARVEVVRILQEKCRKRKKRSPGDQSVGVQNTNNKRHLIPQPLVAVNRPANIGSWSKPSTVSSSRLGPGSLMPCVAFALLMGVLGLRLIMDCLSKGDIGLALVLFLVVLFVGRLALVLFRNAQKQTSRDDLIKRFPDQPWRWNNDWANHFSRPANIADVELPLSGKKFWMITLVCSVIIAVLTNLNWIWAALISLPIALFVTYERVVSKRRTKYGPWRFQMPNGHGVIGKTLEGYIEMPKPLSDLPSIRLLLACECRGFNIDSSNHASKGAIIYREEKRLEGPFDETQATLRIPVCFQLPSKLPETRCEWEEDQIFWGLSAALNEHDHPVKFEVPVFNSSECPSPDRQTTK